MKVKLLGTGAIYSKYVSEWVYEKWEKKYLFKKLGEK